MLALVTTAALTLASPATLKNPPSLLPASQRLPYQYFASAWAPDNSSLYLASSFSIDRFILAGGRLEEGVYVQSRDEDEITAMVVSASGNIILGIGRGVIVVDHATGTGQVLKTFESHATTIIMLAVSNDGTLIASASSSGVHVHDLLVPAKHISLYLPTSSSGSISTMMFNPHSRTHLLLCAGCDVLVYDVVKPSAPMKNITTRQVVVDIACSPFSKTLVAIAGRDSVNLADLEKEKGLFKTILSPEPITSITFSPQGAAIYIGMQDGLRIINLRELDREMRRVSVAEVGQEVVCLSVQKRLNNVTASMSTVRSSVSNPSATSSPRVRAKAVSNARSPLRPIIQRKNGMSSATSSLSVTSKKQDSVEIGTPTKRVSSRNAFSPGGRNTGNSMAGVSRTRVSTSRENIFDDAGGTPVRSAARVPSSPRSGLARADSSESISARLASLRTKKTTVASGSFARPEITKMTNRSVGAKTRGSLTRAPSTASISSSQTKDIDLPKIPADDGDIYTDLSSPDLPMDAVSPAGTAAQKRRTVIGVGRTKIRPVANSDTRSKGNKDKGKDKEINIQAGRDADACEELTPAEEDDEDIAQQGPDSKLSMQVTPHRPTASNWVQSPLRASSNTFPMHSSASNAYELFQGLIADMQAKNHADIKALHIDMLRMGRGLRQEMEEWGGEVRKLREENAKLREENNRLRRGY